MIVILIGYMASGKSTLGSVLAEKLHCNFIDLDDYIINEEGTSVETIFKNKGEIYFRKLETKCLNKIIKEKNNLVLSLGGGTPCYADNMFNILSSKNVKSFYLRASVSSLVERLKNKKSKRPLIAHLNTNEELNEFIAKHLFERHAFYNQAHVKISIDGKSKQEILNELLLHLV
ncbi:MAG: AAA family ATPase [Flavobacteriales bacterium]|nr:AAA family ATPase [Flavobacteriia bacterium]NCP05754.1 AAA family ATPase [Flavobacteriales bacterium]PIV93596.1 MAG: shikimate kinase [Flavobacteriaceae bacterium CG17_big_fil_post_rev_8_21_14_2_50_33_15]PIY13058.1 MAG: shikimate kinase [Flavobacteriaceae bacterium CG_4_10_14_3_um_filter_33_47]PJB16719.1 MAG: shikimate kinase [Flavobacteriaceae bacterium CG_4_9_14_3_um_filter_33_16]